jgi:hypothetical protein
VSAAGLRIHIDTADLGPGNLHRETDYRSARRDSIQKKEAVKPNEEEWF